MSSLNKNNNFSFSLPTPFGRGQKQARLNSEQMSNQREREYEGKNELGETVKETKGKSKSIPIVAKQNFSDKQRQGKDENKQEVVSITYEEIGLFPRSFSRVLDRFLKQIFIDVENLVIQEYRFYRYLFLTTLKCLLILFFVPFFVNFLAKTYVVRPLTEYFWNTKQTEIFLNSYQQKRAFKELKEFEEKTYFESLIFPKSVFKPNLYLSPISLSNDSPSSTTNPWQMSSNEVGEVKTTASTSINTNTNILPAETFNNSAVKSLQVKDKEIEQTPIKEGTFINTLASSGSGSLGKESAKQEQDGKDVKTEFLINSYTMKSSLFVYQTQEADKNIQQRYQEKTIELAQRYNDQSIEAITNFFADLISLFTLFYLLYVLEIQINITKSFLLEVFFGLDDSKKSLLILLITDLLVGYHSSNLWELFFEFLFHHYGLPESQTGIFLLVATLPVLLDVLFKYLIFRHLNRSSPATVATYHAMIE
jgi:hypothetical protein